MCVDAASILALTPRYYMRALQRWSRDREEPSPHDFCTRLSQIPLELSPKLRFSSLRGSHMVRLRDSNKKRHAAHLRWMRQVFVAQVDSGNHAAHPLLAGFQDIRIHS